MCYFQIESVLEDFKKKTAAIEDRDVVCRTPTFSQWYFTLFRR